jgi:hypothetical protein
MFCDAVFYLIQSFSVLYIPEFVTVIVQVGGSWLAMYTTGISSMKVPRRKFY